MDNSEKESPKKDNSGQEKTGKDNSEKETSEKIPSDMGKLKRQFPTVRNLENDEMAKLKKAKSEKWNSENENN